MSGIIILLAAAMTLCLGMAMMSALCKAAAPATEDERKAEDDAQAEYLLQHRKK